nr:MAG TPA: hypothetical protein [Caudoviricetes sp.]
MLKHSQSFSPSTALSHAKVQTIVKNLTIKKNSQITC